MEHTESSIDVLEQMYDHLCKKGTVKDTYCQTVLEKEKNFSTGLNTGGTNIAVPHAGVCHVNTACPCVAVLNPLIDFRAMDKPNDTVSASLVVVLMLTEPHGHLEMLQEVVELT